MRRQSVRSRSWGALMFVGGAGGAVERIYDDLCYALCSVTALKTNPVGKDSRPTVTECTLAGFPLPLVACPTKAHYLQTKGAQTQYTERTLAQCSSPLLALLAVAHPPTAIRETETV